MKSWGHEPSKPGRLPAGNWALLWLSPPTPASPQRPILLVFETSPLSIVCEPGLTRIRLPRPGLRVIAVRPWAKLEPGAGKRPVDVAGRVGLWSRAALAVPINYMSVTRLLEPGEAIDNISIRNACNPNWEVRVFLTLKDPGVPEKRPATYVDYRNAIFRKGATNTS